MRRRKHTHLSPIPPECADRWVQQFSNHTCRTAFVVHACACEKEERKRRERERGRERERERERKGANLLKRKYPLLGLLYIPLGCAEKLQKGKKQKSDEKYEKNRSGLRRVCGTKTEKERKKREREREREREKEQEGREGVRVCVCVYVCV